MSNTIMPVIVPIDTTPKEDPRCPHCEKKLKGWIPPPELTFMDVMMLIGLIGSIIVLICGLFMGAIDRDLNRSCKWPTSYGSYLIPTWWVGCHVVDFLKTPVERER